MFNDLYIRLMVWLGTQLSGEVETKPLIDKATYLPFIIRVALIIWLLSALCLLALGASYAIGWGLCIGMTVLLIPVNWRKREYISFRQYLRLLRPFGLFRLIVGASWQTLFCCYLVGIGVMWFTGIKTPNVFENPFTFPISFYLGLLGGYFSFQVNVPEDLEDYVWTDVIYWLYYILLWIYLVRQLALQIP